jgi:hypothetical protein
MHDGFVNVSVVVAADGTVIDAMYEREQVSDIRVRPFGSGRYDIAFTTTAEASPDRSVIEVSSADGQASVRGSYCSFSPASPRYPHQVTVRVEIYRQVEPVENEFRVDMRLA